jgi:hypothetical protein
VSTLTQIEAHRGDGDSRERRRQRWRWWSLGTSLGQPLGVLLLFLPSACVDPCDELIQLSPSSCGGGFLVNGVGRMIGCGGHRRRELLIDWGATRSKGGPNRHKNGLGRSNQAGQPGPFLGRFGPVLLPAGHLGILDLAPSFVSFWGHHPWDQVRGLLTWSQNFTS